MARNSTPAQFGARTFLRNAIAVLAKGGIISTSGSSATVAIPNTERGDFPNRVRIAATKAAYVRLGAPAEAAVVDSAAGTGYAVGDSITLTGGTYDTKPMTVSVATVKLASLAINAIGSGYAKDDVITLAGAATTQATVTVATLQLASCALNAAGTGYVPADTITLSGGTATTKAVLTVASTKAVSATVADAGASGTPGPAVVTGTTGTGTKFQANVTIAGDGTISGVDSIAVAGSYTVNPADITQEPVTGGGLVGAKLNVVMGVDTFTITNRGNYTVGSAAFTQFATSGSGIDFTAQTGTFGVRTFTISEAGAYSNNPSTFTQDSVDPSGGSGATFNTAVYGVKTATVTEPGDYTIDPANPVAQGSTTGSGVGATFTCSMITAASAGDMLVQPGDAVIVDAVGSDHVAAIQVSESGIVQVSPIEN